MLKCLKNRKGFTLIELMIVVAILGILAAVAVPVFLKYVRDAKTAEATENLKGLGDGALSFYQAEHVIDTLGMEVETRVFPETVATCTAGNLGTGGKVPPADTTWEDWSDLKFQLSKPHYYSYCYTQVDAPSARKGFTATASATLDGGTPSPDSVYTLVGQTNADGPEVGNIIETL